MSEHSSADTFSVLAFAATFFPSVILVPLTQSLSVREYHAARSDAMGRLAFFAAGKPDSSSTTTCRHK